MNTRKNIIKNTIIFIAIFILASLAFFIALSQLMVRANVADVISTYVPTTDIVDDRTLDWQEMASIGAEGFVVDDNKIIRSYNTDRKGDIGYKTMIDMLTMGETDRQSLVFNTTDGNKLFLSYPTDRMKFDVVFDITNSKSQLKEPMIFLGLAIVIVYLTIIYLIVLWLSKKINKDLAEIYTAQEREKDMLFRGIAHDVKTPLAVILSYSKAINDDMVDWTSRDKYLTSIEKNAHILNDRVDELLDFASFEDYKIEKKDKDILELTRRYVGDNYMYFMDNNATIEILFAEDEEYRTSVDERLFNRILQNILQNSIDHNEGDINISIDFKNKSLIFRDSGKGISKDVADKIFNPLFTADPSRTGDKLRGMGLSNVKRICDLHGWKISYKEGFIIEI